MKYRLGFTKTILRGPEGKVNNLEKYPSWIESEFITMFDLRKSEHEKHAPAPL